MQLLLCFQFHTLELTAEWPMFGRTMPYCFGRFGSSVLASYRRWLASLRQAVDVVLFADKSAAVSAIKQSSKHKGNRGAGGFERGSFCM